MSRINWRLRQYHQKIINKEKGVVIKNSRGRLKTAILYPNTYLVGVANLGLAVIYKIINARDDALCERVFYPEFWGNGFFSKNLNLLVSLESCKLLKDFDIIFVTFSFENDILNLVLMLKQAGLGIYAEERKGPLIVGGGMVPMLNPEPYSFLFDGFLLGEAEVALEPFIESYLSNSFRSRDEKLFYLARELSNFYVPRFFMPIYNKDGTLKKFELKKNIPCKIKVPKYKGPTEGLARSVIQVVKKKDIRGERMNFGDTFLFEVGRGCGRSCRFCAIGYIGRPPRIGRGKTFIDEAVSEAQKGGKVGLVSAAIGDLEDGVSLAQAVLDAGGRLSVSSLRADSFNPEFIRILAKSGARNVAFAPEAGSIRLRKVINKHLTENDFFKAVRILIEGGILNIKIYFMIGLPSETDKDVEELINLVIKIREHMIRFAKPKKKLGTLVVSLNAFVPKAWTPFQWEPMDSLKKIKIKILKIRKSLKVFSNIRIVSESPSFAFLQAVFARGDRRLASFILKLVEGYTLRQIINSSDFNLDFYTTRRRFRDEVLPWNFIDHGINVDFLWNEAEMASKEKESGVCVVNICKRCGVC